MCYDVNRTKREIKKVCLRCSVKTKMEVCFMIRTKTLYEMQRMRRIVKGLFTFGVDWNITVGEYDKRTNQPITTEVNRFDPVATAAKDCLPWYEY